MDMAGAAGRKAAAQAKNLLDAGALQSVLQRLPRRGLEALLAAVSPGDMGTGHGRLALALRRPQASHGGEVPSRGRVAGGPAMRNRPYRPVSRRKVAFFSTGPSPSFQSWSAAMNQFMNFR